MWNECDKTSDIGEYLEYKNCKCREKLVNKLAEECTENVEEVQLARVASPEHENVCKCSCTVYVVLLLITFSINVGIGTCFIYYKCIYYDQKNLQKKNSIFQIIVTKCNFIKH